MSNKAVEYIIRAKDLTGSALKGSQKKFQNFRSRIAQGAKSLVKRVFSIRTAMTGLAAGAAGMAYALKTAFEFERYQTQFKVLFGDLEQAKQHMADLQKFSAGTPFQFAGIAKASRQLHIFTDGVMGGKQSLKLIGDAAAAVGTPLEDLTMWVGRAYGAIKAGRPFGEAAMRLMELGVITPEVRSKMEDMQKAGASNIEVWNELQKSLERFDGGMEEMSKTGEGLFSTLKDNWKLAVAEFGKVFMDTAKNDIGALTDKLKELRQNGDIAVWANRVKSVLNDIKDTVNGLNKAFQWLYKWSGAKDVKAMVHGGGAFAGTLAGGGSFKDASRAADKELARHGNYTQKALGLTGSYGQGILAEVEAEEKAKAEREEQIRQKARQRHATAGGGSVSLDDRLKADMAKSQEKADKERIAKEKEEQKKAQEEVLRQKEKKEKELREKEKREREKMEKALWDQVKQQDRQKQQNIQQQIAGNRGKMADARNRMQQAEAAAQQAWGWYANEDAMRAQLDREKEQAKLERRFEKDKERLMDRQGWRTKDNLSPRLEAVRRILLAREKKAKEAKNLADIAKNTKDLGKKLDELLRMK